MIQDIKDEVLDVSSQPDIEPRYTIKDNNGNILNDNVRIELKTPVIEPGTPLNRATMANLQGDLYTQDRYNEPVVEYGKLSEPVLIERDIMPKEWAEIANTVYCAEDGTILTTSGWYSSNYTPPRMFDGKVDTYWRSTIQNESWVKIEFPVAKKITKMSIYVSGWDKSAKIFGSNDDEKWILLYEFSGSHSSLETISLFDTDFYKFYKIEFLSDTAGAHFVYEWHTYEYLETDSYIFNLDLPLSSYEKDKIVNMKGVRYYDLVKNYQEEEFSTSIIPIFNDSNVINKYGNAINKYGEWAIGSDTQDGNYYGYYALDGDDTTYWGMGKSTTFRKLSITSIADSNGNRWAIKPTKVRVKHDACKNLILYGSKDGQRWTTLATFTSGTGSYDSVKEIAVSEYYCYFRLEASSYSTSYYGKLFTFEILSGSIRYGIVEDKYIDNFEFENVYLNINKLGTKQINGTIVAGEKYSLVYNGESFDIPQNIVTGVYSTSGATYYDVNLGFRPKAVIVYTTSYAYPFGDRDFIYGGIAINESSTLGLTITDTGFTVSSGEDGAGNSYNYLGTHSYIAHLSFCNYINIGF